MERIVKLKRMHILIELLLKCLPLRIVVATLLSLEQMWSQKMKDRLQNITMDMLRERPEEIRITRQT